MEKVTDHKMTKLEFTIISRELIKPSSPTPSSLRTYNLSELDQMFPHTYIHIILFYPNNPNNDDHTLTSELLKQSLSRSLTKYYPFAGTLPTPIRPSYIDCNDEGVVFVEVKINSQLSRSKDLSDENETIYQLFADNLVGRNSPESTSVVTVQLNHFVCGGVAVAVSMSHVFGDACTLACFINHWAAVARFGATDHAEVLPLNPHFIHSPKTFTEVTKEATKKSFPNWVTRKFVFSDSKLNDLKNEVIALASLTGNPINNPTRVEVLTSLLYKTAVATVSEIAGGFQSSCLVIAVNIRNKLLNDQQPTQKLPETTLGNLVSFMMVPTTRPEETCLRFLISEIKKEKMQLEGIQSVQHAVQRMVSLVSKIGNQDTQNVIKRSYTSSSFCGLGFNAVDFGWGKAIGASLPLLRSAETCGFLLMDTPDGDGIEATVILAKEEMEVFEKNREMLSFCQIKQL